MRKENIRNSVPEKATAAITAAHLLHPAKHFDHPRDVLAADGIGDEEKRAILASWASDIFAIKSIPGFRLYPGTDNAVSYDDIIEALKALDKDDEQSGELGSSSPFNLQRTNRRRPRVRRFGVLGLCSYRKEDSRRRPLEI
ncbi:UNVERIFIED_ORG: hypothetical protein QE446_005090 [Rhizobium sp. SORGH_AS260]|uniref:hypothetical protein n=1 Tax=Agrobacterium sp. SORGH_AS_0440 TaxID=3041757 RepID=UPI002789B1CC|nr:hypothetical protein [Agrobacterium sp. SORGH_AS_0440]MDP9734948.1 hypothetical protein [Rhizobium sp. SORGH_AS_0285]MDP9757166.1 hypothetical protein [Rhizobium sp. SORGH_AS_0260]MDR6084095.1 hypothetical protein [Agrobacterium sp. SORGH_AS_0440]